MASGRLGAASLAATTNTTLYTVPTSKLATFNVSITNTNSSNVTVRLALAAAAAPAAGEWLMYDYTLPAYSTIERTGLVLEAARLVVGYTSATNVNFVVYGLED